MQDVIPPRDWGRRLSDRIREALDAGDLASARRLAVDGDGQARSLEKEFALMYRGLGITVRVLLALLAETVGRAAATERPPAAGVLAALLARFRREMTAIIRRVVPAAEGIEESGAMEGGDLGGHVEATVRLLTDAEARFSEGQARLAAEVVRAIEAGDLEVARAGLDRKETGQYVPLHDRLVRLMAEAMGFVLERFGPDQLYRFHLATAEGQRRGFDAWERLDAAAFARTTAFLLKQHMGTVAVSEDGERFTIVQTPCGSGGRLRLSGVYGGPEALAFVEGPGPLTAGEARMPVYCTHCPIWNGVAPLRWYGRPHWVLEEPSRPDGSCTLHIYKRRDGAAATYARRLELGPAGAGD